MRRTKSLPAKLNTHGETYLSCISYHNFQELCLKGQQTHLSFGNYCESPQNSKNNRKKAIQYTYKRLHAKL